MPNSIIPFLMQYFSGSGLPGMTMDGLINYKHPLKAQGSMPDEEYARLLQKNSNINQSVNQISNGLIGTQTDIFTNKQDFKTNPYGLTDSISKGVLNTAAKLPGIQGLVGQGLSLVNTIGAQKVKKDNSGLNMLNETSAFSGAQSGQGQQLEQVDKFNNAGLFAQLFAKKENRKKGLQNSQNAWKSMGQQAKQLQNSSTKVKQNLSSVDTLNQKNQLLENGFNYNLQFGKKGIVIERNQDPQIIDRKLLNEIARKNLIEIYALNKDLSKKIKELKDNLFEKKIQFKETGGPVNLIVDGQLHANKHAIKTTQLFKDAPITNKGVPVVTMEEGGDIDQHQEVERDEMILHYDLTKKMEELCKLDSEEAAIEAGKILQNEILKNTKDKNKLLKTIN